MTNPWPRASAILVLVLLPALALLSPSSDRFVSAAVAEEQYDDQECKTDLVDWTNDRCAGRQWGLTNIQGPEAWAHATGQGVTVAVVDTGVDFSHPDLQDNLIMVPGSDMTRNKDYDCPFQPPAPNPPQNSDPDAVAQDDHGHGTHVAGIIAAVTGNGIGVAGVAPQAKILPVKVLDRSGMGTSNDVARGICFAVEHGANVINLSLGSDPAKSILIQGAGLASDERQAIQYALDQGIAVIAAAGNESFPICDYPAALPGVLCVGAVDRTDQKAWYSNFGPESSTAPTAINHVVAPGGAGTVVFCHADLDIWSTIWPGSGLDCDSDGYDTLAGTSMAAPHVAGVAALVAQRYGGQATPDFIYAKLKTTADDLGTTGVDPIYGHGRVNALRAVTE